MHSYSAYVWLMKSLFTEPEWILHWTLKREMQRTHDILATASLAIWEPRELDHLRALLFVLGWLDDIYDLKNLSLYIQNHKKANNLTKDNVHFFLLDIFIAIADYRIHVFCLRSSILSAKSFQNCISYFTYLSFLVNVQLLFPFSHVMQLYFRLMENMLP